ncbi:hypothetical protein PVK06_017711 [Gossypium arboreum]|uniref:Uncharacterized protein n=1 Tax=Gossypium arboreum TaxID=29729 RepID=A0ABR0Q3G6_GOSAR|nr:hypothetical protein PVK06_017711 [Gossypium arboreum]
MFHTKSRERLRRSQNCGIVVNSSITSYTGARDSNPIEGNVEYYGLLINIIELDYYGKWKKKLNSEQQIAIGSSNVPNTADESAEIQTQSGGRRKTRGRTLLNDLYELNSVERVKVAENCHGQPIGSEARLLVEYLGIIARIVNLLPINYESWHHMSISNKNQALDNIKDRERVGTTSKQKQKFTHTARSKSFARVADDKEKLKDKRAEYEVIASSDSSVNLNDIDNRIITKILGPERYDRVRFQGYFVNPTQYFRSSSQQYMPSRNQAQAEVQRLRDQMA